jgi:hypothetical protein
VHIDILGLSDGLFSKRPSERRDVDEKQLEQHANKCRIQSPALAADYLRRRSPGSGISAHFTILATSAGLSS